MLPILNLLTNGVYYLIYNCLRIESTVAATIMHKKSRQLSLPAYYFNLIIPFSF